MEERFENNEQPGVFIDAEYEKFVPQEFKADPFTYFEDHGVNIKSGEKKVDENGKVREDPTAVKDMEWTALDGEKIDVVGKKVNTEKAQIAKTGNPLHEFEVLTRAQEFGLPCAKPIARAEKDNEHLLITERIDGIRLSSIAETKRSIAENNLTQDDLDDIISQATAIMEDLERKYRVAGIIRKWNIKDMVLNIDYESKKIKSLIPTDWERTKLVTPEQEII